MKGRVIKKKGKANQGLGWGRISNKKRERMAKRKKQRKGEDSVTAEGGTRKYIVTHTKITEFIASKTSVS